MKSPAELENAFEEGVGFDGSSIEEFSRISESDTLLRPDPSTHQPLPFDEGSGIQTARMFCDITMPDGDPLFADPREVLRRQLNAAAMHRHFSLFEGDTNAFHDPDDEISSSTTGRQFIAGAGYSSASCSAKKASRARSGATSLPTSLTFALQSRGRT